MVQKQHHLTIATRGSQLAVWQAEHIRARLLERHGNGIQVDLLLIKTTGDRILDVPLAAVGGKGLFVKEIEEALLDGRADMAVHSMKDVPMFLPDGLCIGAIPEREDASDVFLSTRFENFKALPPGARIGTSSLRRQAQLLAQRQDLEIISLRGNVDTRLRKLETQDFDAIILANAALKRLNLTAPFREVIGPPDFLPAVGQGALGLEFREDRDDVRALLDFLDHTPSRLCVNAERAFLATLEGNCQVPVAAHAIFINPQTIQIEGLIAAVNGSRVIRGQKQTNPEEAEVAGRELAKNLLDQGGHDILQSLTRQQGA